MPDWSGAPHDEPFRLRVVQRETFGRSGTQNVPIGDIRQHIGKDLANDIGALLASGATFDGKPVRAGDVAVIVETHSDARVCQLALGRAGIASVYTGDSDIFDVGGGRRLAVAAGGVRSAAPRRGGACRRGDDVLRQDRAGPGRRAVTR